MDNNTHLQPISLPPTYGMEGSITEDPEEPDRFEGMVDTHAQDARDVHAHVPVGGISKIPSYLYAIEWWGNNRTDKTGHVKIPIFQDIDTRAETLHYDNKTCCANTGVHVTIGAEDLNTAAFLMDSLMSLSPLLTTLSASSPVHGGFLTAWDSRLKIWIQGLNDNTPEERETDPNKPGRWFQRREYLGLHENFKDPSLNDVEGHTIRDRYLQPLLDAGLPEGMARFFAMMCTIDVSKMRKGWNGSDVNDLECFEAAAFSQCPSIRLKNPDKNLKLWRVEVRALEPQLKHEDNAYFISFVQLLAHLIRDGKLNTAIPISKYLENHNRSHETDAATKQKFFWNLPELGEYSMHEIMKDIESRAEYILN